MTTLYNFQPAGPFITAEEWRELFHPDDRDRLTQEFERVIREHDKFQFEFRAIRPNSNMRWILSLGRVVRDSAGKALRLIGTHTDVTDRKQAEEVAKVREFTGKLMLAQDAERRRIARELHDSAGQLVAALQMSLEPMKDDAAKLDSELAENLGETLELVQQLSQELRTVSHLLHPPLLDELGLPSALKWYVEGYAERSKIDVQLELANDLGRLPVDMETALFRIVQESLTNIHRHSGSKSAFIRVARSESELSLEVSDFGRGMPTAKNNGSQSEMRFGVGIQGMQERVRQLNGKFEIRSHGTGTVVTVRLPITVPAPAVV